MKKDFTHSTPSMLRDMGVRRRADVRRLLSEGMSVSAIAKRLGVADGTVYRHISVAKRKGATAAEAWAKADLADKIAARKRRSG